MQALDLFKVTFESYELKLKLWKSIIYCCYLILYLSVVLSEFTLPEAQFLNELVNN